MLKYRFLCTGFLLRLFIFFISSTSKEYILISQGCPLNIIQFSIMSLLLISDILFLIDFSYYYINMECLITIRVNRHRYYAIIFQKLLGGLMLLLLSSLLIPYHSISTLALVFLDKICLFVILYILLITCLKYKKTDGIILCYFIIVILRFVNPF